jgi:predicted glycosyltransferase involved in capsule biosynthesis
MISFVFYTCLERIENLKQTLRLLDFNEPNLTDKEIIIIFQNKGTQIDGQIYEMNLDSYQKPKMCNFGVKKSNHKLVALMDSDRVLPKNYFYENMLSIKKKQMITTTHFHNLKKEYTDDEIKNNKYEYNIEYRSKSDELLMKNLFSGNTLFFKSDYLEIGGMDEQFIGYGHADTDMTKNAMSNDINSTFIDVPEIHLWHEKKVLYQGKELNDFEIQIAINTIKFAKKWKQFSPKIDYICKEVIKKISLYPEDLVSEFLLLYRQIYGI